MSLRSGLTFTVIYLRVERSKHCSPNPGTNIDLCLLHVTSVRDGSYIHSRKFDQEKPFNGVTHYI
jgi:hypothetical protein